MWMIESIQGRDSVLHAGDFLVEDLLSADLPMNVVQACIKNATHPPCLQKGMKDTLIVVAKSSDSLMTLRMISRQIHTTFKDTRAISTV